MANRIHGIMDNFPGNGVLGLGFLDDNDKSDEFQEDTNILDLILE